MTECKALQASMTSVGMDGAASFTYSDANDRHFRDHFAKPDLWRSIQTKPFLARCLSIRNRESRPNGTDSTDALVNNATGGKRANVIQIKNGCCQRKCFGLPAHYF